MSLFSSIFAKPTPAPVVPPTTVAPAAVTNADPPPTTQVVKTDVSPMDQFSSLWEPAATVPAVDGTLPTNMFSGVDPVKMLEAAKKVDFAKSISPDTIAKITAGGPEAAAAFAAALNSVSQQAYAQSSFATTKIVESALQRFQEGLDTRLPSQLKQLQVTDSFRQANPALAHPAAATIVEALQKQFSVKYPNASVQELQGMAEQYVTQFAALATPKPPQAKVAPAEDWDSFFATN